MVELFHSNIFITQQMPIKNSIQLEQAYTALCLYVRLEAEMTEV